MSRSGAHEVRVFDKLRNRVTRTGGEPGSQRRKQRSFPNVECFRPHSFPTPPSSDALCCSAEPRGACRLHEFIGNLLALTPCCDLAEVPSRPQGLLHAPHPSEGL